MAIVRMQKLGIAANKKHRKAILETLQGLGAMEIFTDQIDEEDLRVMDTMSQRTQFQKEAEAFDKVLKLLDRYAPKAKTKSLNLTGREIITSEQFRDAETHREEYINDAKAILKGDKQISECEGYIVKDQNTIASLEPWMKLDIPMNLTETKKTEILLGTLPDPITEEMLYAAATRDMESPAVMTQVLSSESGQTCIAALVHKKDAAKVEENLRLIGFAKPAMLVSRTPAEEKSRLERDMAEQKKIIEDTKETIASYGDRREYYKISADYFRTRAEKYRILGTIPQSEHVFFLEGWVTCDMSDRISRLLTEQFGAYVEKEETKETDDEPTVLHNNSFSSNAEGILASYGLPRHGKVDPTFLMSIFYVFFFGMMLSDGGYGIVMAVGCAILIKKFPRMEEGMSKMIHLFFWCGISTAFWGFMYGGFFGDAIDTIAHTFFGVPEDQKVLKALWFEPVNEPMRLLLWCLLFGNIHLLTGLGIKGYQCLKDKDTEAFICDVLSWYLFVVGLILVIIPTDLFAGIAGAKVIFPGWLVVLSRAMAIVGAVIILLFGERGKKNWALRIAMGAYDLYGITSWLSDALSYSRLLALGLATGVIASVINLIASMGGRSVVGVIMFIIVFILGHTLNIAINALGAYVHTNRLQYVEFFGKFYDGGGRAFVPFKQANRYIQVKEEERL
ncbi:MAG: V-type ATP synthase subunit I [Lachnospiraceae bacterium]|nr:V-type ATP synthase subunit I [Lachnospiraceae bacterium]